MKSVTSVVPSGSQTTPTAEHHQQTRNVNAKLRRTTISQRAPNDIVDRKAKRPGSGSKVEASKYAPSLGKRSKERTTVILITRRACRSNSSGSSDPTGTSSTSSGNMSVSQDSNISASSSRQYEVAIQEGHESSLKLCTKRITKRPRKKVIITDSFADFRLPHGTRNIRILVRDDQASFTKKLQTSQVQNTQTWQDSRDRMPNPPKDSSTEVRLKHVRQQLSPKSLRRARLRFFDKTRRVSSSSSASLESLFANDRRGSILLPRQHQCEPIMPGHHDAAARQRNKVEIPGDVDGSPDPGSPHAGGGLAYHEEEKGKDTRKPHFRIANLRVVEILRAIEDEAYSAEIIPHSLVSKLEPDDSTMARITEISTFRHDLIMTGVGKWDRVDECRNRLEMNEWCYLRRSWTRVDVGDSILVPLTNSRAKLLRERLRTVGRRV